MNRKEYIAIAKVVRESDSKIAPLDNPTGFELDKIMLVDKLVKIMAADNPLFDKAKFREACLIPHSQSQVIAIDEKLSQYWK